MGIPKRLEEMIEEMERAFEKLHPEVKREEGWVLESKGEIKWLIIDDIEDEVAPEVYPGVEMHTERPQNLTQTCISCAEYNSLSQRCKHEDWPLEPNNECQNGKFSKV
jgi:hypothetical protein